MLAMSSSIRILRYDRRPEPRAALIAVDWRSWLTAEGFALYSSAQLAGYGRTITFEIFARAAERDPFALYHPAFGPGAGAESLYLLPHATAADQLLQIAQQLALVTFSGKAIE